VPDRVRLAVFLGRPRRIWVISVPLGEGERVTVQEVVAFGPMLVTGLLQLVKNDTVARPAQSQPFHEEAVSGHRQATDH
jgi:hypothetical protein